jgi:hypothetical protein
MTVNDPKRKFGALQSGRLTPELTHAAKRRRLE